MAEEDEKAGEADEADLDDEGSGIESRVHDGSPGSGAFVRTRTLSASEVGERLA
jgi:hypothetical protein